MKMLLSIVCLLFPFAILHVSLAADPKAGDLLEMSIKDIKYRFRYCPAGTFTMGSPLSEKSRHDNEQLHTVTLTKGFYLAETEVTQEQWESVMENNSSHFKGAKLPVETVNWSDCQTFIAKLNKLSVVPAGYTFALPTEAQWEYACRAGSTTAYYFGDDGDKFGDYAWYDDNSDKKTHEVGTKKPNTWNLYDMHGNVLDWCADWYDEGYSKDSVTDPTGDSTGAWSGGHRVCRGGGWRHKAEDCRSPFRYAYTSLLRVSHVGVRLALVPVK